MDKQRVWNISRNALALAVGVALAGQAVAEATSDSLQEVVVYGSRGP